MRRKTPEHDLQKQVIQWLNYVLVPPAFAWSVDHAGGGILAGSLRKARGVRAGQPDIWVLGPDSKLIGIELKSKNGRVSPEQYSFGADCSRCGVRVFTCWTLDNVEEFLRIEGYELRGRLSAEPPTIKAARGVA